VKYCLSSLIVTRVFYIMYYVRLTHVLKYYLLTLLTVYAFAVVMAAKADCHAHRPVVVSGTSGYLASLTAAETGCGTSDAPWLIEVMPGQRINVTLFDFSPPDVGLRGQVCACTIHEVHWHLCNHAAMSEVYLTQPKSEFMMRISDSAAAKVSRRRLSRLVYFHPEQFANILCEFMTLYCCNI